MGLDLLFLLTGLIFLLFARISDRQARALMQPLGVYAHLLSYAPIAK
jgi:hypothetical protein